MTESDATPRRRVFWKYLLAVVLVGILLLSVLTWYVTTDSFQALVRGRLVAELQRITGGRVELGGVHTIPFRFQVDVRNLTIHGRESSTDVPYIHLDRLVARIKIISLVETEFGFHSVVLDHPVIHIVVYPDGTTNQPVPQVKASSQSPLEQLFSLSISRLEIRRGEFLCNDQRIPIDFVANDVSAGMEYSVLHRQYSGDILLGKVDTTFDSYRPVAWMAEAHFDLAQNALNLRSFKASSGRSRIQANGRVVNFADPNAVGDYDATIDLAEAAAISRQAQLRNGTLQLTGHGSWSKSSFSSVGKLLAKDAAWRDPSLNLQGATLASQYSFDPQRLAFSSLQSKILGGEVTGTAEINNWLAPSTPITPKQKNAEQRGLIRLKVRDLSVQEIARALASSARPLERVNLAGNATGTVETRWRGALRNAETELAVGVNPPAQVTPGKVALSASGHATYRNISGEWQVDEFRASTHNTHLVASGTLSRRASLKISLSTSDLSEWEPIFNASGYMERSPAVLRGHASFNGTASGKISEIAFAGKLQSQDLTMLVPATETAPQTVVHWDSFSADVQLSPEEFIVQNGQLRHAGTSVQFNANAELQERKFVDVSTFSGNLRLHGANVAEILAIAGQNIPASGTMDLSLQASGTRAQPQGHGTIHLTNAVIRGEAIAQADSNFSFDGEQVSLQDIALAQARGTRVTGEGTYDFVTRAFRLNLHGEGFDLANFPQLQASRIAIGGRLEFDAHSSGTLDEPIINAKILLHDLSFNGTRAGDYTFDANTQGSELRLSGRSQFRDAELSIDGDVHLRDTWPATVNLHFNHLDVNPVIRSYSTAPVTGPSVVAGDLQLIGPLRDPRQLQVIGNISEFLADVSHIQVHNNGPVHFAFAKQVLDIQQLRLIGQGTDLTVEGKIHMADDYSADLKADGHADLALLQSFDPDLTSSGLVSVNVTADGPIRHPVIQGRLQLSSGSIQYSDLPSALSDMNGTLVFNQDRLQIESLTAHVGGGLVKFGGYATAYNRQLNFDLTLQAQDVRLRYPPGVSSTANADLRWAGSATASVLSGDVTVNKLAVTPGFDFGSYLARSAQASALPQTNPVLNRIRVDVHIVTTPELQMQTASVQLTGDADLRLRGTAAKPVLLGRADVIEGAVYFNGTKYHLERGDVSFANPVTTTPVLDLQATTKVREYDITLNLNGEVDKLNLSYHSEPPLPTADIISLLALGQTQEQSAQIQQAGGSPLASQATSAVLNEALNAALSNRSQRLFGISHIKIDPQGISAETIPTSATPLPAVTIEQQVRDNLTLTYTTNVAQTSQQIIQGEYNVTRDVSIVGIRDYNGVVSFEVRLRRRKK